MSVLSKLFGRDGESEKLRKFRELEESFGDPEMVAVSKALWLTSRGQAYYRASRFEDAMQDFRNAISVCPEFSEPYLSLAIALREQGRPQEALNTLGTIPTSMKLFNRELPPTPRYRILEQYVGVYLTLNDTVTALAYARQTQDAMREYRLWLQTEHGREQQTLNPDLTELLNEQEGALAELIRDLTA